MNAKSTNENVTQGNRLARPFLLALGWLAVLFGIIGIFIPGLPTTPFLLVALWAFSKTSKKFHDWLINHPKLGPPLRDWQMHGVIPVNAKIFAFVMMTISLLWVIFGIADDWILPSILGGCLLLPAIFILTRPSEPK